MALIVPAATALTGSAVAAESAMDNTPKKNDEKSYMPKVTGTLSQEHLDQHYDINFEGSFDEARERAHARGKFVLAYIRDASMQPDACAYLDKYVWCDSKIRQKLSEHFVFWKVDITDGEKLKEFLQTYEVHQSPYICIFNAETGEMMSSIESTTRLRMLHSLSTFAEQNSIHKPSKRMTKRSRPSSDLDQVSDAFAMNLRLDSGASAVKRRATEASAASPSTSASNYFGHCPQPVPESTSVSPESISVSPESTSVSPESNGPSKGQKRGSGSDDSDEAGQPSTKRHSALGASSAGPRALPPSVPKLTSDYRSDEEKTKPTPAASPSVTFAVRSVDGRRVQWTVSIGDRIQKLLEMMEEMGFDRNYHELMAYYPMRNFSMMSQLATLSSIGLTTKEVLYIREKDDDDDE